MDTERLIAEYLGRHGQDDAFGEHRLLERIGGGRLGVVYLAEHRGLRRQVALKLLRPDLLHSDSAMQRWSREVRAAGGLHHTGIPAVLDVGAQDGIPFLAMEYVEGASLADSIDAVSQRAPSSLSGRDFRDTIRCVTGDAGDPGLARLFDGTWAKTCLLIAHHLARALSHAHQHGIVHGEVKPSNVLVTRDGRVVLVDLGLAQLQSAPTPDRSAAVGAFAYLSPERHRGQPVDERSDVYSLGVTLFEMLALRPPFSADDSTTLQARILEGRAPRLRELNASLSRDVETVCLKAMETQPARRYQTAKQLADELIAALELRPISARRAGVLTHAMRWIRRNRLVVASVGLG